jgi:CRP-like cAMP-binding protein
MEPNASLEYFKGIDGTRKLIRALSKSSAICGDRTIAEKIVSVSELLFYPKDSIIIKEGDEDDDMYFFVKGSGLILLRDIEVNRRYSSRAEHIGEMSMIEPDARRSATVKALEDSVLLKIDEVNFSNIAEIHPELWRNIAAELGNRIRQRNDHTLSTIHGPTVSIYSPQWRQVITLLERIPASLKRWTWEETPRTSGGEIRKWHIDSEYHVQNLLYTVLAPLFPDIQDEITLGSVGSMQPRSDLIIPFLNLIIEVKIIKPNHSFNKILGEIAEDSAVYRATAGGEHKRIIAFVWDDSCRSHKHDSLRQGIRKLSGIDEIVIVSRPTFL